MARPRKPAKLQLLSGETRPSRLRRAEPQSNAAEPEPPDSLTAEGLATWQRVTEELAGMGMLFRADEDAIYGLCSAVATIREEDREIKREGRIVTDIDGNRRRNPRLIIRAAAVKELRGFASDLGLSPVARTHLGAAPPSDPDWVEDLLSDPDRVRRGHRSRP